jgi:NhaA family Na+:H+ antiporter
MDVRHLVVTGVIAGLGLTVALFVAGKAFPGDSPFQDPGKMGAVLSIVSAVVAYVVGIALNVRSVAGTASTPESTGESAGQGSTAND